MAGIARSLALLAALSGLTTCATAGPETADLPSALEAGWQGKNVCESLYRTNDRRVLRCTFPPGVGHERHFHPAHFGYALSGGTMRLVDANGTRDAKIEAGTSFSSKGIAWHEVMNIGDTTVTYLIFEEF